MAVSSTSPLPQASQKVYSDSDSTVQYSTVLTVSGFPEGAGVVTVQRPVLRVQVGHVAVDHLACAALHSSSSVGKSHQGVSTSVPLHWTE